MDRKQLYDQMRKAFNESELRDVCFYMDMDYEAIPVQVTHTIYDKMRELIQICEHTAKLPVLLQSCERVRPDLEWFSPTLIKTITATDAPAQPQPVKPQTESPLFTELLTPLVIQLKRTQNAFHRWTSQNLFLESEIIRKGNLAARDLLIDKAHLIPPDLVSDAHALIYHYDRWLEKYDQVRGGRTPDLKTTFVFTGPDGAPFPVLAERHFIERFEKIKGS